MSKNYAGYGLPDENTSRVRVTATDFNPFDALGLNPATASINPAMIQAAWRAAARHRAAGVVAQNPATANAFPSLLQINMARDFLIGDIATARHQWAYRHTTTFVPTYATGDRRVFPQFNYATGNRTTVNAPTTPRTSGSATGTRRQASTSPKNGSSSKSSRTASTGAGSTPGGSGTKNDPVDLDDDDNDDVGSAPATPTPANAAAAAANRKAAARARDAAEATAKANREARRQEMLATFTDKSAAVPAAGGGITPAPAAVPAAGSGITPAPAVVLAGSGGSVTTPGSGGVNYAAFRPGAAVNRSGSGRQSAVANPPTDARIVVGTWNGGSGTNAVVAGFDVLGRLFYRITNRTLTGAATPAPNTTSTNFAQINLRAPYTGMTHEQLRVAVENHARMPEAMRP